MNDLLVNITPEHYERYAIEGTSPWNAYLMERILEEASGVTSAKKKFSILAWELATCFSSFTAPKNSQTISFTGLISIPVWFNFVLKNVPS